MGVAHSNLPTLSTLVLEMSVCSMMLSMWLHSWHNMTAWGIAFTLMYGWSGVVRYAYNVDNPLAPLVGQDLIDGQLIYFGIFGFIAFGFALLGDFICLILDLPGLLPIYACIFGNRGKNFKLWRWGRKCPPPYRHTVITFLLFAAAILPAFVTYSQLMDTNRGWALGVATVVPFFVYIVAILYWWFDTDLYVFGPTARNTKNGTRHQRGQFNGQTRLGANEDGGGDQSTQQDQEPEQEEEEDESPEEPSEEETSEPKRVIKRKQVQTSTPLARDKEESGTRFRIIKTALVFGVVQILSTMILGFIRFADNNVDTNWIAASILGGVILILALILALIFWFVFRRRNSPDMVVNECDVPMNSRNQSSFNSNFNNNSNNNIKEQSQLTGSNSVFTVHQRLNSALFGKL